MRIPWKFKSFLFGVVDIFDAFKFLYFAQKYLTRRSQREILDAYECWLFHKSNLEGLVQPRVLEFGAGKNLAQNIFLSSAAGHQTVVDLFPMFDADLADAAARSIERFGVVYSRIAGIEDLAKYGISYVAPYDISRPDFPDDSFDCCISTNTLEHIPKDSIIAIFSGLRKVLRKQGLISAAIDYSDHYSHTDASIGPLEFLRYSAAEYARHNHKSHYQNRLRHYNFERIFRDLGYTVLISKALNTANPPPSIGPEFDTSVPATFATRGLFLLRNEK